MSAGTKENSLAPMFYTYHTGESFLVDPTPKPEMMANTVRWANGSHIPAECV